MLEIKHLTFQREKETIFKDFSLSIAQGERLVIMGESGAGKSTLLRLIAGFITPSEGEIYIDGRRVSHDTVIEREPSEREIGMVFQDLALWPHLSVMGNIAFGLKIQKIAKQVRVEKVAEVLALVGLEGYENRKISSLSGGEQQRIALARALVRSPKLLLMDEPLSSLDSKRNAILRQEIVRLQEALGFTLIYVTHSEVEAEAIATRILQI